MLKSSTNVVANHTPGAMLLATLTSLNWFWLELARVYLILSILSFAVFVSAYLACVCGLSHAQFSIFLGNSVRVRAYRCIHAYGDFTFSCSACTTQKLSADSIWGPITVPTYLVCYAVRNFRLVCRVFSYFAYCWDQGTPAEIQTTTRIFPPSDSKFASTCLDWHQTMSTRFEFGTLGPTPFWQPTFCLAWDVCWRHLWCTIHFFFRLLWYVLFF